MLLFWFPGSHIHYVFRFLNLYLLVFNKIFIFNFQPIKKSLQLTNSRIWYGRIWGGLCQTCRAASPSSAWSTFTIGQALGCRTQKKRFYNWTRRKIDIKLKSIETVFIIFFIQIHKKVQISLGICGRLFEKVLC
jgi:hypothetical protein